MRLFFGVALLASLSVAKAHTAQTESLGDLLRSGHVVVLEVPVVAMGKNRPSQFLGHTIYLEDQWGLSRFRCFEAHAPANPASGQRAVVDGSCRELGEVN